MQEMYQNMASGDKNWDVEKVGDVTTLLIRLPMSCYLKSAFMHFVRPTYYKLNLGKRPVLGRPDH